jgi:hypothetical protein
MEVTTALQLLSVYALCGKKTTLVTDKRIWRMTIVMAESVGETSRLHLAMAGMEVRNHHETEWKKSTSYQQLYIPGNTKVLVASDSLVLRPKEHNMIIVRIHFRKKNPEFPPSA